VVPLFSHPKFETPSEVFRSNAQTTATAERGAAHPMPNLLDHKVRRTHGLSQANKFTKIIQFERMEYGQPDHARADYDYGRVALAGAQAAAEGRLTTARFVRNPNISDTLI
jgi:hypothetical protein